MPTFPLEFEGLLGKTIEGIAKDAERRINIQIEAHAMHEGGEPWLSEGLGYIRNNDCPFCGQSLNGIALIAAYRAYFSEAYNALRTEITTLRQQVADTFGDRVIAGVERIIDQNSAGVEFWSRYCTITPPVLAVAVAEGLFILRNASLPLLDRKAASPLEPVAMDASFTGAHAAFRERRVVSRTYNQAVRAANAVIAQKKAVTGNIEVRVVQSAFTLLQAIKKRTRARGQGSV